MLVPCPECSSDLPAYSPTLPGSQSLSSLILPTLPTSPCPTYPIFQAASHTPGLFMFLLTGTFLYHILLPSLYSGLFTKVTSSEQTLPSPNGDVRQQLVILKPLPCFNFLKALHIVFTRPIAYFSPSTRM